MEIMIFALLAGYLFFRLWNVLGVKTGADQPFDFKKNSLFEKLSMVSGDGGKIKTVTVIEEPLPAKYSAEIVDNLEKLTNLMPKFTVVNFLKSAELAFKMIIKCYSQGDINKLQSLVSESVYKSFLKAINERAAKKITLETVIESVEAELVNVALTTNTAQLTVCFKSEQMVAHVDEHGANLDNPAKLNIKLVDFWTFERFFKDDITNPTWVLIKTSADS